MNQSSYKFLLVLFSIFTIFGCRKYVELEPKGKITPTTFDDYKLLVNNNKVFSLCYGTYDFLTDDIAFTTEELINKLSSDPLLRVYRWESQFYQPNQDDAEWNLFYQQIYTANVIIDGVSELKTGTPEQKMLLIAQAKVHRAYAYLCLVNLYGKQYQPASSGTDLGVPILLKPDNTQSLERASVEAVYKQLLDDLQTALAPLPDLPASKTYPSKAAVYAILARTYLMMGDYEKAGENAGHALELQNGLLDLATVAASVPPGFPFPGFYIPATVDDPEVIFIKAANNQDAPLNLSDELLGLMSTADLRKQLYTFNGPDLGNPAGIFYAYFAPLEPRQVGPRVPEMMLIKAECLARADHYQEGLDIVNDLRKKRFKSADYTGLTATNKQDALAKILEERRRELFGRGFRLFDLKRLNLDPQFAKTVEHPLNDQTLSLPPNDNRYVYPIGSKIMAMSPDLKPNPR